MNTNPSEFSPVYRVFRDRIFWIGSGIFLLAFLWFWFWRPYGFYGGDSEFLDRQVNGGLWFRKREVLAVAAMQLSRQVFTLHFGWPVSWSISLVSCLAGATSVLLVWLLFRQDLTGPLRMILVLASGHTLLYYGSIEAYALPTAVLMLWIYAIHQVEMGRWSTATLPFSFALMTWCHLMALFLFPALLVSAWIYRDRVFKKDLSAWILAALVTGGVYVFIHTLRFGEGLGIQFGDLFFHTESGEVEEVGTFFTLDHLKVKSYFIGLATQISLPFALLCLFQDRTDRIVQQVGGLLLSALLFVIVFHPDCGYKDWDLFLLPSLPAAILGSRFVARSRRRSILATFWVLAFLFVWCPRIPVWARLSERGLAKVEILNYPDDREVRFDGRYPVRAGVFYTQGGPHRLEIRKPGYRTYWKDFVVAPGDSIEVEVPLLDHEVPFAAQIRELRDETPSDSN